MARKLNLYADSGSNYSYDLVPLHANGSQRDLTNHTANAALKPWYTYGNTTQMDTSISGNTITVSMNASTTDALSGKYIYDVIITSNTGNVNKVFEGNIEIQQNISS